MGEDFQEIPQSILDSSGVTGPLQSVPPRQTARKNPEKSDEVTSAL